METKMGRPRKSEHRKKQIRYGKIEDTFNEIAASILDEKDRKKVLKGLEELKK